MGRSFLLALAVAASLALPALAADRQQGDFPTGTQTYAASPAGTANLKARRAIASRRRSRLTADILLNALASAGRPTCCFVQT